MKKIKTRSWSTPVIVSSGMFVASSGIMMFLGFGHFMITAHEWLGIVFTSAMVLHILEHRNSFTHYFKKTRALYIMAAIAIAAGLITMVSLFDGHGRGHENRNRGRRYGVLNQQPQCFEGGETRDTQHPATHHRG